MSAKFVTPFFVRSFVRCPFCCCLFSVSFVVFIGTVNSQHRQAYGVSDDPFLAAVIRVVRDDDAAKLNKKAKKKRGRRPSWYGKKREKENVERGVSSSSTKDAECIERR